MMLTAINPKLPMRNKAATRHFYVNRLGFADVGAADFDDYLILEKDSIQLHFFKFKELDPNQNYGQVYIRTDDVEALYEGLIAKNVDIHPNGKLEVKPWGQKEFALLDPDTNLLTFGQAV